MMRPFDTSKKPTQCTQFFTTELLTFFPIIDFIYFRICILKKKQKIKQF